MVGKAVLGVLQVGLADPWMPSVEGDRAGQLLVNGPGLAAFLTPAIGPWLELERLANPGVDGDGNCWEPMLIQALIGGPLESWGLGRRGQLGEQAPQQFLGCRLGGLVDAVHHRRLPMVVGDPVPEAQVTVGLLPLQLRQRLAVGLANGLRQAQRGGPLK